MPKGFSKGLKPRLCEYCGEWYQPYNKNQKICGKKPCRIARQTDYHRSEYERNRRKKKKIRQNVLTKANTLVEDAWAAKQLGVSYGNYKAMQYFS